MYVAPETDQETSELWCSTNENSLGACAMNTRLHLILLQAGLQVLEEASTQLWWAGKEICRGKKLLEFVGRNEKTKIVAKLQKKGQGPPAREAVFTEEEKKMMMAYAYRKQEDHKVT